MQKVQCPDERKWQHRILPSRDITTIEQGEGCDQLRLLVENSQADYTDRKPYVETGEVIYVDALLSATGYIRDAYEDLLRPVEFLRPEREPKWKVQRNYRVMTDERKIDRNAGLWLQGCNETTHGLSDTLLSVLAVRGGEMVQSIFGDNFRDA